MPSSGNMLVDRHEKEDVLPEIEVCLDCGKYPCICDEMYDLGRDD